MDNFFVRHLQGLTTVLALIVAVLAIFAGIHLARGNADIVCSTSVSETGACRGGNWSTWGTVSETTTEITERRVYTGVRTTISGTFSIRGNIHALNYCNLGSSAYANAQGTITSQQAACQIEETRVRSKPGTGDPSGSGGSGSGGGSGTIVTTSSNESTGAALGSTSTQGTYQDYFNVIDASLATSSIRAVPTLVRAGDTVQIIWSSERVISCTVEGTNGDAWTGFESDADGETSSPITERTSYVLRCETIVGSELGGEVVVNIVPTFDEQ